LSAYISTPPGGDTVLFINCAPHDKFYQPTHITFLFGVYM